MPETSGATGWIGALRRWLASLVVQRAEFEGSAARFQPVVVPFGDARPSFAPPPGRVDARALQGLLGEIYGCPTIDPAPTEPARRAEAG